MNEVKKYDYGTDLELIFRSYLRIFLEERRKRLSVSVRRVRSYKLEGRGFDSRRGHWDLSLT